VSLEDERIRTMTVVNSADFLDVNRLAVGVLVEYLGDTVTDEAEVLVGDVSKPLPLCDRLWRGHPGVVREPVFQHVLVDWVGLEAVAVSLWTGFSCNDSGVFRGLGVLAADEFERRRQRVLGGASPI
jgi:hypothetical protein